MRPLLTLLTFFLSLGQITAQYRDNTPASGFVRPNGLVHILDIELAGAYAYAGGSGGLWIVEITSKSRPRLRGTYTPKRSAGTRGSAQIYGLAVNGSVLYACERTNGVEIIDISDPVIPAPTALYRKDSTHSYEHVLQNGSLLYLAAHENGVETVDITNPSQFVHVTHTQTTNAFALARSGNHLFVADGAGGLSVLDISQPNTPVKIAQASTTGMAIDVELNGTHAYVAVGSKGLDVFDISQPNAPQKIANYHTDGFTNHLKIANDRAYLANWETTEIVNISTPQHPQLIATQHAFERAMAIAVDNNTFYVGDWATFRIFDYEDGTVPDINTDPLAISFGSVPIGQEQKLTMQIENLGQEPLSITNISAVGSGFSVPPQSFVVAPGENQAVEITYQPAVTRRTTGFVSIKSDDPDEPEKIIPLTGGDRTIGIGDTPPDFALQDIQGNTYSLKDLTDQGTTIVLAMFASW